jgi:hypothetical protein
VKRKLGKFMELPFREKMISAEALLFQFITGLILKLFPFRMIPRLFALPLPLKSNVSNLNSQISSLTSPISNLRSFEIKQAIQNSSKLSPWGNKCLVQSLAARWMLNRRNITSQLSLGVARGEDQKMIGHAWLKTGDIEVVEKRGDYNELYFF